MIFYTYPTTLYLVYISSQIQRLCLTKKLPVKCFQNLSCFIYFKNIRQKFWIYLLKLLRELQKAKLGGVKYWTLNLRLSLLSLTIFSFCLLQKCPWKPYHSLFCDVSRKTRKITYFLCCQWEWMKKENTSISSSWLKILWYLKKLNNYSTPYTIYKKTTSPNHHLLKICSKLLMIYVTYSTRKTPFHFTQCIILKKI